VPSLSLCFCVLSIALLLERALVYFYRLLTIISTTPNTEERMSLEDVQYSVDTSQSKVIVKADTLQVRTVEL
jgi:hypothetical protein